MLERVRPAMPYTNKSALVIGSSHGIGLNSYGSASDSSPSTFSLKNMVCLTNADVTGMPLPKKSGPHDLVEKQSRRGAKANVAKHQMEKRNRSSKRSVLFPSGRG